MSQRKLRIAIYIVMAGLCMAASLAVAQQPRTRPQADIKVTYKTTMPGGAESESTTMIKGTRQRSEQRLGYGMDQISITQCDLRRTIQVSDGAKKYMITPMESGDSDGPAATATTPGATASGPARRGGVITSVITSTDTGERKEMFGFTARHIKTSVRMESSPDACNPLNMRMEQDGWYIDLNFGLNCELGGRPTTMGRPGSAGCQDKFRSRHVGAGRTGFPLIETTIGYDQNGREQYRITKEVADLSRQPLDAALFDIPAGYTETSNSQDLYAMNQSQMMQQAMKGQEPAGNANAAAGNPGEAARPGAIRIGVVQLNNKTKASLSTEELRGRLVGNISNAGIEAIPLNAISLSEAQAEAKEKQCAYILLTDISSLKTASAGKKLGGLLGRATGVDTNAGKSEAKLDFKLFATGSSSPKLSSSESGKEDGEEASLSAALEREAAAVVAAAQR